jgi:hypothetical protein
MGAKYVVYDRKWLESKVNNPDLMPDIDAYVDYIAHEWLKEQAEKAESLMLESIKQYHRRLGCTRVCDKMDPTTYAKIHAPQTPKVMTPPREAIGMSDMKPEEVGSKYDVNLPEAQPLYKNPQA